MRDSRHVTLPHAPGTRSAGALLVLEELGAGHERHLLAMTAGALAAAQG